MLTPESINQLAIAVAEKLQVSQLDAWARLGAIFQLCPDIDPEAAVWWVTADNDERAQLIDAVREPRESVPASLADKAESLRPAITEIIAALDAIGAFASLHPE